MVQGTRLWTGQPQLVAARSPGQKIQKLLVLAQDTLLTVFNQRVESAMAGKQLPRILLHPQPGPHLQCQWQKNAGSPRAGLPVQVVPHITMRKVLQALRLKRVTVVAM